jgi:hypothetical protein
MPNGMISPFEQMPSIMKQFLTGLPNQCNYQMCKCLLTANPIAHPWIPDWLDQQQKTLEYVLDIGDAKPKVECSSDQYDQALGIDTSFVTKVASKFCDGNPTKKTSTKTQGTGGCPW